MFDGIYADGLCGITLWRETGKKIIAGTGLNAFNSVDFSELSKLGIKDIIYSKELSLKEIGEIKSRGYVFSFGRIKLAEFLYCPFGKKCGSCKRTDNFTLKDYDGRAFRVRRYKISSCRFEVYNCLPLKADKRFKNEIYDFTLLDDNEQDYYSAIIANKVRSENQNKLLATSGNFKKGVE